MENAEFVIQRCNALNVQINIGDNNVADVWREGLSKYEMLDVAALFVSAPKFLKALKDITSCMPENAEAAAELFTELQSIAMTALSNYENLKNEL